MKANLLKSAIIAKGLTVEDVAKQLNLTRNTMYKRLNGKSDFNTTEIAKLCEILDIRDAKHKVDIFLT